MTASGAIKSYKDLDVWTMSMSLAENCYRVTKDFPRDEMYGMTAQIRRAASSIPANVAEGYGRDQTGTFIQFLRIALGELASYAAILCRVCWTIARGSARCFAL
jgi:four helix bundle protein